MTDTTYTLSTREIPLHGGYDVIVVGGGPAGVAAAYSSAREGARTLLIEATGALGGMSTMGMVPTWSPYSNGERIVYGGLAKRILDEGKKETPFVDQNRVQWVPINPEAMKRIYDGMMDEAGVEVLYGTALSAADADGGKVNAVIVTNKAGLSAYRAKVYIDCTGDGDLSAFAGAEFHIGENDDPTTTQLATHCFELSGVNDEVFTTGVNVNPQDPASPLHRAYREGKYDIELYCNLAKIGYGAVGFNAGHLSEVDGTDPVSLSRAYPKGRRLAEEYRKALAEYYPEAFGNAFVHSTAPLMGIRESRRIVGDYTLTTEDYLSKATFPDEIARNCYYLDLHMTEAEKEDLRRRGIDPKSTTHRYGRGESHGIPYRCLTPKGLVNLLVAGRIISCDRQMQGSVRVMPNCFTTGEAAGTAGAMAAMGEGDVKKVDVGELRQKLRGYGAYFE